MYVHHDVSSDRESVGILRAQRWGLLVKGIYGILLLCVSQSRKRRPCEYGVTAADSPTPQSLTVSADSFDRLAPHGPQTFTWWLR